MQAAAPRESQIQRRATSSSAGLPSTLQMMVSDCLSDYPTMCSVLPAAGSFDDRTPECHSSGFQTGFTSWPAISTQGRQQVTLAPLTSSPRAVYCLLLGHMAALYEAERDTFLERARAERAKRSVKRAVRSEEGGTQQAEGVDSTGGWVLLST
jgi:hypothetical protein